MDHGTFQEQTGREMETVSYETLQEVQSQTSRDPCSFRLPAFDNFKKIKSSDHGKEKFLEAIEAYRADNVQEGIELLDAGRLMYPRNREIILLNEKLKGILRLRSQSRTDFLAGKYQDAKFKVQRCIAIIQEIEIPNKSMESKMLMKLSLIAHKMGDKTWALYHINRALDFNPTYLNAFLHRAHLYRVNNMWCETIKDLETAKGIDSHLSKRPYDMWINEAKLKERRLRRLFSIKLYAISPKERKNRPDWLAVYLCMPILVFVMPKMEHEYQCSCLKKYRKTVGFLDIIIGVAGIVNICCLTYTNRSKSKGLVNGTQKLPFLAAELDDELVALDRELQIDAILYVAPSLFTILVGVLIFFAAKKDSFVWSKVALILNVILIVFCGGVVSVVFGSGTYWMQLLPLIGHTCLQVLFLGVVLELYRSTQHLVKLQ